MEQSHINVEVHKSRPSYKGKMEFWKRVSLVLFIIWTITGITMGYVIHRISDRPRIIMPNGEFK